MTRIRILVSRFLGLFRKARREKELDEELRLHLELLTEENVRRGMSPEEARCTALRSFGGVDQIKERYRDQRGLPWVESFLQDLRYALRGLRKNPGFTAVAVITLALGIGATTAIFTVVNGVLLRPLPYPHPEELVYVQELLNNYPLSPYTDSMNFAAWRNRSQTLAQVGAYMFSWFNLTGGGEAQRVNCGTGSGSFFSLLGARPMLGRLFTPEEDRPGGPPVALLSEPLWRSRYKADASIVGKSITLDGKLYTVVGVLPATFVVPDQLKTEYALWVPLAAGPPETEPFRIVRVVGRLKPGGRVEAAQAELDAITQARLKDAVAKHRWSVDFKERIVLARWHEQITRASRLSLLLFLGAVSLLLLIACVNVANLLLSRAATRQKEMAVRLTVGAGKSRLVRQLLTESTLLAVIGGLLGVVLAQWGKGLLISFISPNLPVLAPIGLDYRVLAFTFTLAVATGVLFGLAPALQAARIPLNEVLKEAGRGAGGDRAGGFFRSLLIVGETALAMILLVGSGLLYRSFLRVRGLEPGFRSEHMLSLTLDLTLAKYPKPDDQARYFERVIDSIEHVSGVESVAGSNFSMIGDRNGVVQGGVVKDRPDDALIAFDAVTPGFFRTLHIPLLSGRYFNDSDQETAPSVAIVNQAFVRHYFPGRNVLGRTLVSWVRRKQTLAIVGVVGDVRSHWERAVEPEIYIPCAQGAQPYMVLLVHTAADPLRVAPAIREQIARIDRDQPPHDIASLDDLHAESLTPRRVNLLLLGAFALLGLVLASVGIYGVVSYAASQRTHEIGLRMALGAERADVLRVMVWHGLRSVLMGTGLGLAASLGVTRFLQTLLFEVKPTDPATLVAVSFILVGVALVAAYIPARRATKVDPMVALRYE
jgi:putative ABC transport system permease protein